MNPAFPPTPAAGSDTATRPPAVQLPGRRNRDVLGLAWINGSLEAAVFRRQTLGLTWSAPRPVLTLGEFETALDQALTAVKFAGAEVFLILAHEKFVHQAEHAPAFSENAARLYLRGRVQRHEQDHEPVLWVSQRTVSPRQESAFLLHLLPASFYDGLNGLLRNRQIDLTRIIPLTVPLQLTLDKLPGASDQPVLLIAPAGSATTLQIGQAGKPLYFSRTMLAGWSTDAERIAVEANRSLLYAKQQFGVVVNRIVLLGRDLDTARTEILNRCGADKDVRDHEAESLDWLKSVARLPVHHPVNLVAGYISRKRRLQFLRRVIMATAWLVLILGSLESWSRAQSWHEERDRLNALQAGEESMLAERDRLLQRNTTADHNQAFIRQVTDGRLPPVPASLLAYVGSSLPMEISLTGYNMKWEAETRIWSFRLEGQIVADAESAQDLLIAWQESISLSPVRPRFHDNTLAIIPVPVAGDGLPVKQRFSVEGGIYEN